MMPETDKDPSVASLVGGITRDIQTLVRGEIELAKAELANSAKHVGLGAGLFVGALSFLLFALLLLAMALSFGIALLFDWPTWSGFAIVGALLIIIAVVLVLFGVRTLKKINALDRTKLEVAKTKSALADRDGLAIATGLVGPETLGLEAERPRDPVA
jgi:uncharacterized membrane protein YqjE